MARRRAPRSAADGPFFVNRLRTHDPYSRRVVPFESTRPARLARLLIAAACLVAALSSGGGAQAATTIRGIDISNWNSAIPIDWLKASNSGIKFIFAKASEGTTFTDATYPLNRSGAELYGIHVGAYHFARPAGSSVATITASAIAQADYFSGIAQPAPGDLPPALDLEVTGNLSPANLTLWTQTWLDEVDARTGVQPFVYTSPKFWEKNLGDTSTIAASGTPLWIAHWTKDASPLVPALGWNGASWTFWQWSDCAATPGFAHCVDADRFSGLDLTPILIKATPATAPVLSTAPSVVGTAQVGKVLAAIPGRWTGQKPVAFTYQWESCSATGTGCVPIAGATSENFTPTGAESGHAVVALVTAANSVASISATSPATVAITGSGTVVPTPTPTPTPGSTAPVATTPPQIEGDAVAGETLSLLTGDWGGSTTSFSHQWERCNTAGESCVPIAGATATQYVLTPGDIGSTVGLAETATDSGGSGTSSAEPTPVVTAQPLPTPVVRTATAVAGAPGAVRTLDAAATVSWQPGAVPAGSTVSLARASVGLALPKTAFALGIAPSKGQLPWPIALEYTASPTGGVLGFSTDNRVWKPVTKLSTPALPVGQTMGWYRDGSGTIHVLSLEQGRFAFFAANQWGDPRLITPGSALVYVRNRPALHGAVQKDGTLRIITTVSLQSQAHLHATLLGPSGKQALLIQKGSRLGAWLSGVPLKTVQSLVLKPGTVPIRLSVHVKALTPRTTYRLEISAVDPVGRKSMIVLHVRFGY
jgi:GH25 family lysozyme M1 (1,4-beta-N-acetylmuramidase)